MTRSKINHRFRPRHGFARYWDCINPGCGEFVLDLHKTPRKRMPGNVGRPCPVKRERAA